jgi:tetratricopeptide (TPR) repeat protein
LKDPPNYTVNRDNALFVTIGILIGFIAGYVLHEVMAARQPPRLPAPGAPSTAQQGPMSAPAAEEEQAPAVPPMAEIQRLREHVEKNPNDADAVLLLANLNFDIKNWARARTLYEQYLTLKPGNPDVLTDLGVTLRALGEYKPALGFFNRAVGMSPTHWQARFNKVVVLALDLKDFPAAEVELKELQRLQPQNASVAQLAAEVARRKTEAGGPSTETPRGSG